MVELSWGPHCHELHYLYSFPLRHESINLSITVVANIVNAKWLNRENTKAYQSVVPLAVKINIYFHLSYSYQQNKLYQYLPSISLYSFLASISSPLRSFIAFSHTTFNSYYCEIRLTHLCSERIWSISGAVEWLIFHILAIHNCNDYYKHYHPQTHNCNDYYFTKPVTHLQSS